MSNFINEINMRTFIYSFMDTAFSGFIWYRKLRGGKWYHARTGVDDGWYAPPIDMWVKDPQDFEVMEAETYE